MNYKIFGWCCVLFLLVSCADEKAAEEQKDHHEKVSGQYRAKLILSKGQHLPFDIRVEDHIWVIENAEEQIALTDVKYVGDSVFVQLPVFDSEFRLSIREDGNLGGEWINNARSKDKSIDMTMEKGDMGRFVDHAPQKGTVTETRWEVTFSPDTDDAYKAIGLFKQDGELLTGTFMTETGDYRFLEGNVIDDVWFLSCFDGAHAFYFGAELQKDGSLKGAFKSGKHWTEPWVAHQSETFELSNPEELTYLKDGYDEMAFAFADLDSNVVTMDNYKGKPVILQIMGSWCPNCMDETAFLSDWYAKRPDEYKDLEILAIGYERTREFDKAKARLMNLKAHYNIQYDMVVGGFASKSEAAATLPMLNHVMSYPTTIYINRAGKVEGIHTGFNGPATGAAYDRFQDSFLKKVASICK